MVNFVTEVIEWAFCFMVAIKRVKQSESAGYRASVHDGEIRGRPSFTKVKSNSHFFLSYTVQSKGY